MALPVAAEIDARLVFHRQSSNLVGLIAIRNAAVIFAPRCFLSIPEQISARDMMMVADLGAAHAAEKFLGPIRARNRQEENAAIGLNVIVPRALS
jgi:hypothetical protein